MIAHDGQRQACAVGNAVQIPFVITQRDPQIRHIGSIFRAVIGLQIDTFTDQTIMTGLGGIVLDLLRLRGS